jgi:fatty-acyl-CoA synthase
MEGGRDLVAEMKSVEPAPLVDEADAEAICWLAYTGGTTGRSKGVMIAHRCVVNMSAIIFSDWEWPQDIRYLAATPITHAGGVNIFPTLMRAGSSACCRVSTSRPSVARVEAEESIPPSRADDDLCTDRRQGGSRSVRPFLARDDHLRRGRCRRTACSRGMAIFGNVFVQFYGQTEVRNASRRSERSTMTQPVPGDSARADVQTRWSR